MGLEVATYISGLNASNPVGVSDPKSQGDDHLRLIKSTLLNTFPNISGAMNASQAELNRLVGVTGTTGTGALVLATSPIISSPTIIGAVAGAPAWGSQQTFAAGVVLGSSNNVSPGSGGHIQISGAGYTGFASLDGTAFYIGHNSGSRNFVVRLNGNNELTIIPGGTPAFAQVPTAGGNTVLTTATGARLAAANTFSAAGVPMTINSTNNTYVLAISYNSTTGGYLGTNGSSGLVFGDQSLTTLLTITNGLAALSGGALQARVATSSETSGTLTSASANKHLNLSGGITLNNTVFTAGDKMTLDAGGSDRTITRGAGCTMYVNGVDSATATLPANTVGGIHVRSASVFVLTGVV